MCISGTVSKFCCHWVLCQISVFSGLCVHILCHLEFHVRRCLVVCFVSFSAPVAIIPWTTGQNNSLFAIMAYLHTYSRVHHILSFNLFFSCVFVWLGVSFVVPVCRMKAESLGLQVGRSQSWNQWLWFRASCPFQRLFSFLYQLSWWWFQRTLVCVYIRLRVCVCVWGGSVCVGREVTWVYECARK